MAEWSGQMAKGDYSIQFSTKDKEEYKFIEKACQSVIDKTYKEFTPVVSGEWLADKYFDFDNMAICSVCNELYDCGDADLKTFAKVYNYCPNCGARMDKGGAG